MDEDRKRNTEAVKIISNKQITKKRESWSELAIKAGLVKSTSGGARINLRNKILELSGLPELPKPKYMNDEAFKKIQGAIVVIQNQKNPEKLTAIENEIKSLPSTAKQKINRLIKKEFERCQAEVNVQWVKMQAEFNDRVGLEFQRVNADWLEISKATAAKHSKAIMDMQTQARGITPHISEEDYKFLCNVLHPDRAPDDRVDKFSKAFQIIRRLDVYIETVKRTKQTD